MVPRDPVSVFRRFEYLKDLTDNAFADLARYCVWQSVPSGKQIILANESTADVYFVAAGKVRVLLYSAADGREVLFTKVGTYEMFGEVAAIDGHRRSATVEAEGDCVVAILKQEKFRQLVQDHSSFAFAVMGKLAADVRRLSERVYEFSTLNVESRVHAELLRCAVPDKKQKGQAVISPVLRAEFAARISTNREAVSRVITRLEDEGIAVRKGQDIHILNLERLRNLVISAKGE